MSKDRTLFGILLMVGFSLIAPLMDSFAKLIGDAVAVGQIAATRFAVQSALLLPLAAVMGWMHRPGRGEIGLHLARSALLMVATAFFFTAVRYMPIADAIAIFFVEPFILTLLGGWLLGEQVGPRRYVACAVGFGGALLIIQPSFQELGAVAFLPLVTALCFAFYMILTRRMATRMHPITLQVYTGLAALVIALPVLWAFNGSGVGPLDPVWPEARELKLLAALGIVATISHVCISFALVSGACLGPGAAAIHRNHRGNLLRVLHLRRSARRADLYRHRADRGVGSLCLRARTCPATPPDPRPLSDLPSGPGRGSGLNDFADGRRRGKLPAYFQEDFS